MQLNNNKGLLLIACLSVLFPLWTYAQQPANNTVVSKDGNTYQYRFDYGQLQKTPQSPDRKSYEDTLYRVSLDTFEEGGNWSITLPADYGRAFLSMREGVPDGVKDSPDTVNQLSGEPGNANANSSRTSNPSGYFVSKPDAKNRVLGAKVTFFPSRRVAPWMRIDSVQPINLSGTVRGFEVFVSGREIKHELYIIVEDIYGKEQLVSMGSLNFLGWRKMTAQVPSYIVQQDPKQLDKKGLVFKGFFVKFRMLDSIGSYFIYFDNLSAEISRFTEENQLKDDIRDNW